MGAIQSKRGSVRQAPPDVYMPFMSGPAGEESDAALKAAVVVFTVIIVMLFGIGLIAWALEVLGLYTPSL